MKKEKLDFVYIFNFEGVYFDGAIERLRYSLESIKDQNVNICLSNNSTECIFDMVSDIHSDIKYIHKPYNGLFSRALTINFAVKSLVKSEYFMISDIDLIYQKNHVQILLEKVNESKAIKPIRFISYNYNEEPIYSNKFSYSKNRYIKYLGKKISKIGKPYYSSNFEELIKLPKSDGGYAHGNGLIHLESFIKIQGYDEEMIGYGPEDDLFNTRISKINDIIYDNSIENATVHLWHPRFHMIQHDKNMQIWRDRKDFYNSLENPIYKDVLANKDKKEWGII